MPHPYTSESIWYDKYKTDEAERRWHERATCSNKQPESTQCAKRTPTSSLVDEIARARQHIKHSLQSGNNVQVPSVGADGQVAQRICQLEKDNQQLRNHVQELQTLVSKLEGRISSLELSSKSGSAQPSINHVSTTPSRPETKEEDDDIDLFGSDEDQEANELRDKRVQEYAAKKSKKPQVIAKSSVVLDVKPWDDETDMSAIEVGVRKIEMDGLLWGASKLAPLAYGIMKLQICCVVQDDKVSIEELQEKIEAMEDLVQSVDIAAFNKI